MHGAPQLVEARAVRRGSGTHHDVAPAQRRREFATHELPQAPLHTIARNRAMVKTRHDDRCAPAPGLDDAGIKPRSALTSALGANACDLAFAGQPGTARKSLALKRQRTWTGA